YSCPTSTITRATHSSILGPRPQCPEGRLHPLAHLVAVEIPAFGLRRRQAPLAPLALAFSCCLARAEGIGLLQTVHLAPQRHLDLRHRRREEHVRRPAEPAGRPLEELVQVLFEGHPFP